MVEECLCVETMLLGTVGVLALLAWKSVYLETLLLGIPTVLTALAGECVWKQCYWMQQDCLWSRVSCAPSILMICHVTGVSVDGSRTPLIKQLAYYIHENGAHHNIY